MVAQGELSVDQRNELLKDMTEEVAGLVLKNNYRQTQAISAAHFLRQDRLEAQIRLMRTLEREGKLDRSLEYLPNDEQLAERAAEGAGLTRPELAILLSYVKIDVNQRLLDSDAPEDAFLAMELERYFPGVLTDRYRSHLQNHPLRREIIATHLTNSLVNSAGLTMVHRYCNELGYSAANVVRAYAAARETFGIRDYRREVEALDNQVSAETQFRLLLEGGRLIERATLWLLQNRSLPLDIAATVQHLQANIQTIAAELYELVVEPHRQGLETRTAEYVEQGVPAQLAARAVGLGALLAGLDIVDVGSDHGLDVRHVARVYFMVGHNYHLYWMREQIIAMQDNRHWQRRAADGLY